VQVGGTGVPELPLRTEAELYRIAGEALANVRRHADAHAVEITLRERAGHVELTVYDDGRGFDPAVARAGRHGVAGMRERAKLLGGSLRVESRSGRGTRIVARVPVTDPSPIPSPMRGGAGEGSGERP